MSNTEKYYQQAAEWAEHDMTLKHASTTALRGEGAATFGRGLLERAAGDDLRLIRRRDPVSTHLCGRFDCRPR